MRPPRQPSRLTLHRPADKLAAVAEDIDNPFVGGSQPLAKDGILGGAAVGGNPLYKSPSRQRRTMPKSLASDCMKGFSALARGQAGRAAEVSTELVA
jgi:hypothetical protein